MLEKIKGLKNSVKEIQKEMEKTNTVVSALATKFGLEEHEEDDG